MRGGETERDRKKKRKKGVKKRNDQSELKRGVESERQPGEQISKSLYKATQRVKDGGRKKIRICEKHNQYQHYRNVSQNLVTFLLQSI